MVCTIASTGWSPHAEARATSPDGLWGIAQIRANMGERTTATAGALHLGGLGITAPFLMLDRSISPHWEINTAYYWVTQEVENQQNPNDQLLRAGVTFKQQIGRILVENRTLYEAVLTDQGRENANRLRNLTRVTYKLAPQRRSEPRLFGHVEPVVDDRDGRPLRIDVALGVGATLPNRWQLDLFGLRQTFPAKSRSGPNALVLQLLVPVGAIRKS